MACVVRKLTKVEYGLCSAETNKGGLLSCVVQKLTKVEYGLCSAETNKGGIWPV